MPAQPLTGVTIIVPVMDEPVAFCALKLGMFPVPLATKPIAVLLFVQLNVVPAKLLLNERVPVGKPLQTF